MSDFEDKDNAHVEYNLLLKSGMFWEFYPELNGNWEKDCDAWCLIYKDLNRDEDKREI
jgi:hypothetical protein